MKLRKRISRWLLYRFTLLGIWLAGLFPPQWNLRLGRVLGWLAFWLVGRERKRALAGLNIALGRERQPAELKRIAIELYQHLGQSFFEVLEFFYYHRLNLADFVSIEGIEYLDQGLSRGKGVVFVSAHLGNWELMSPYVASLGYPVSIVARRINNEGINNLILGIRRQNGVQVIMREKRGRASRSIFRALLNNQVLGVLMDQDARVDGVFVDFFGRPAYTPSGPVALALSTGATIIPGFITRKPDGQHLLKMLPPFDLKITGHKQQDILTNTQELTKIIEDYVRRFPSQWVWMHRRWRRQPKDDNNLKDG
jgi:KDO2-lipid IV(A) lauroyltransferase